jgi:hypothetical protein
LSSWQISKNKASSEHLSFIYFALFGLPLAKATNYGVINTTRVRPIRAMIMHWPLSKERN